MSRRALSHPRRTLAIWGVIAAVLAVMGIGVGERLHRTNILINDSDAGAAQKLQEERFGEGWGVLVLLEGPESTLERQGPQVVRRLGEQPNVSVISPWAPGLRRSLRPEEGRALIIARVKEPFEQASREAVPEMRERLERIVKPPLEAHLTGYPDIANAIHTSTVEAIERAELIAAPLLIIILLLVFRSPVAAAVPLLLGLTTVGAAGGVLDLINRFTIIDSVAFSLAAMMGLALGVDYSLLLVSRFREELATGQEIRFAAHTATTTAGHTVRFAGVALGFAMVAAMLVAPGTIMLSAAAGTLVAVLLSVVTANTALPAILLLLGERINAFRFGKGSGERAGIAGVALGALRRPALAGILVFLLIAALAAPALAIETGPPDPRTLPESSEELQDFDAISDTIGGGWSAPYEITVATKRGAITEPRLLEALGDWQNRLAKTDDVIAVLGPGQIAKRTEDLRDAPRQLARGRHQLAKSDKALGRLNRGLGRAAKGTDQLRDGLAAADEGAAKLASGGDQSEQGALQLRDGLQRSSQGAATLQSGLSRSSPALATLARGAGKAGGGSRRLRAGLLQIRRATAKGLPRIKELRRGLLDAGDGLEQLREPVGIADDELDTALDALNRMSNLSQEDPQYQRLYLAVAAAKGAITGYNPFTEQQVAPVEGYDGLDAELAGASDSATEAAAGVKVLQRRTAKLLRGTRRLARGSADLRRALKRISGGATRLSRGGQRAVSGAGELSSGLSRLEGGAGSLASGVSRLQSGADELSQGLSGGNARSGELESGIGRIKRGVLTFQTRMSRSSRQLQGTKRLQRVLESGYTTLAALESADPETRAAASEAINVDRGGTAARIVVIEDGRPTRTGDPLRVELEEGADDLAAETGTDVRVGGPAAATQDFDEALATRFPLMIALLCVVTYLVLIPLLRSVLLPLLAVALNVLTVGAALGVLTLCFQGSAPLGGPGFIDDIMRTSIFSLVFALSIDYEVFLLARMREGYVATGDANEAIAYGLRHTAGVITGAALIMTGVFVAFAVSPIINMRELGLGLTVAVLLDATLVRLVLLPAAMRLAGERIWWMPAWLGGWFSDERRRPLPEEELARVRQLAG